MNRSYYGDRAYDEPDCPDEYKPLSVKDVKAHITRLQELQSPIQRQAQENQLMIEQRIMRLEAKLAALTDTVSQLKETVLSLLDSMIEQKKGLE
jgi:hypothetical protein